MPDSHMSIAVALEVCVSLLVVYPQDNCYQFASLKLQNRLLEILPP